MNKKIKVIVSLLLVLCVLSGCAATATTEPEKTEAKEPVETTQTTETPENKVEAEESAYPEYLNLESDRPIVKEGNDITLKIVTVREGIATSDINENYIVKFIEDKLNVNLEIEELTAENLEERKSLMMASNDLPDILINMQFTTSDIVRYGVDGEQFLPLSDYFSEELTPNILATLAENEAAKIGNTAPDGKMYTVPVIRACYPGYGNTFGALRVFYDTDYMEAAGIAEIPSTLDEFVEMLRAYKEMDPSVMGVDEIYPMVSTSGYDKVFVQEAFGWVSNTWDNVAAPAWDVNKQEVVIPCLEETYADYIKFYNMLYTEGLIHPDYFTLDYMGANALFAEGKVPVLVDDAPYVTQVDRWDHYVGATPVTSEWNNTPVVGQGPNYSLGIVYVSAETEYPELCLRLIDFLYSTEGIAYGYYGCPAGSDDTMGIIQGYTLDEDNNIVIPEVQSGEFESDWHYSVNKTELFSNASFNFNWLIAAQKLAGVENPQYPELDISDPDQHYRYLCYNAQNQYLVPILPDLYLSTEESEKYMDMQTVLKNYVDAETAKFVVGQRSLDEIDDMFEELKDLGSEEYLELTREYYKDYVN